MNIITSSLLTIINPIHYHEGCVYAASTQGSFKYLKLGRRTTTSRARTGMNVSARSSVRWQACWGILTFGMKRERSGSNFRQFHFRDKHQAGHGVPMKGRVVLWKTRNGGVIFYYWGPKTAYDRYPGRPRRCSFGFKANDDSSFGSPLTGQQKKGWWRIAQL